MKNFLMRGVVLVMLLSFFVLPASAAFDSSDSTNIANIKSYTYDIKTALTSGTLATNVSSIKTSVSNISSYVQTISTKLDALKGNIETINSRIGTSNQTGFSSLIQGIITLGDRLTTGNSRLTDISNASSVTNTRLSDVNTKLDTTKSYVYDIKTSAASLDTSNSNILNKVTAIAESSLLSTSGISTEAKQNTMITNQGTISTKLDILSKLATNDYLKFYAESLASHKNPGFTTSNTGGHPTDFMFGFGLSQLGQLFTNTDASFTNYEPGVGVVSYSFKTPYGLLKNLSDTLASDEYKEIHESQNDNVDQVKQDFISGSSGGTSLGKSDFGDLSTAGSTAKDLASLNGQASINKFTDGLTDADTFGMVWFSAPTKSALDSVSSSLGTQSFDPSCDSDPYNMAGFSDNYNWLFGGD